MVASLVYSLIRVLVDVMLTSRSEEAELQAEVRALRCQVQVLERQVKRVRWTPADRMILAALRERLPRSAWAGLLVKPETVLGWHRALVRQKGAACRGRPRRGRPPIPTDVRQLIIRMARENPGWGYFRLRRELLKLGHTVAATTVRSVLLAADIPPAPQRWGMSWKQFLRAHAESVIAADFFSVDTIFFKRLYVFFFVHLSTRRILMAACTAEPNGAWVTQQDRQLSWGLEDEGIMLGYVIHDRDRKFAAKADAVFKSEGARIILTPLMAPLANSVAERWVGAGARRWIGF